MVRMLLILTGEDMWFWDLVGHLPAVTARMSGWCDYFHIRCWGKYLAEVEGINLKVLWWEGSGALKPMQPRGLTPRGLSLYYMHAYCSVNTIARLQDVHHLPGLKPPLEHQFLISSSSPSPAPPFYFVSTHLTTSVPCMNRITGKPFHECH